MPARDLSHHEGHSHQLRAISIQTKHIGYRGIFTTHNRWQTPHVRVIHSSKTGNWPFKYFWVFNQTLKKLELIFGNILHLKTKQNKALTVWYYCNQDLDEKNIFCFGYSFKKQNHQKLSIKSFHLLFWNTCHWSIMRQTICALSCTVLLILSL